MGNKVNSKKFGGTMKYITNQFGICPLKDAIKSIDINLQYLDFVPEDTPLSDRAALQTESFLKKLNKTEMSEFKSVIERLKNLQKNLAECVADNEINPKKLKEWEIKLIVKKEKK